MNGVNAQLIEPKVDRAKLIEPKVCRGKLVEPKVNGVNGVNGAKLTADISYSPINRAKQLTEPLTWLY